MPYKTYKDGTVRLFKAKTREAGPEVTQFINMLTYLKNTRDVNNNELILFMYSQCHPEFWITTPPWNVPQQRFFMELILVWLKVYKALEKCNTREEFLNTIGLTDDDVKNLVPRGRPLNRKNFPGIAERFGKLAQLDELEFSAREITE